MSRSVRVIAEYLPDRSLRLTTGGPSGVIELADGVSYSEIGPEADAAVRKLHPDGEVSLDIEVPPPPWVKRGDFIRIQSGSDSLEGTTTPYAQVVGFLPIGGVLVVHPEAGAGIYSPDSFDVVSADDIEHTLRERISQRSGIPVGD